MAIRTKLPDCSKVQFISLHCWKRKKYHIAPAGTPANIVTRSVSNSSVRYFRLCPLTYMVKSNMIGWFWVSFFKGAQLVCAFLLLLPVPVLMLIFLLWTNTFTPWNQQIRKRLLSGIVKCHTWKYWLFYLFFWHFSLQSMAKVLSYFGSKMIPLGYQ